MTANGEALQPMNELIKHECGIDLQADRFRYVGMEDIPGFDAIHRGEKVDVAKVEPGVVKRALEALKQFPKARAFLIECTQCCCFSDSVRHATGLPVFDAITNVDYFMSAHQNNSRFGLQDWQKSWDGV